jgi:polyisoprenoid-binding protein YceI
VTIPDAAKWESASIDVEIQTASVFTDNDRRDADLRSSNFFAADSFPTITFTSTRIERNGDGAKIYGDLTIRGVTKPVVLDGHFLGLQNSANGAQRFGFDATTTVNRLDYGVKWNRAVEGGGMMLGDDVKIEIAIEAVRQPAKP